MSKNLRTDYETQYVYICSLSVPKDSDNFRAIHCNIQLALHNKILWYFKVNGLFWKHANFLQLLITKITTVTKQVEDSIKTAAELAATHCKSFLVYTSSVRYVTEFSVFQLLRSNISTTLVVALVTVVTDIYHNLHTDLLPRMRTLTGLEGQTDVIGPMHMTALALTYKGNQNE